MTPRVFPRLYLASDAEATGPHDAHDVLDSFRAGSLTWDHPAAIEGTDDWQPLGDILRAFFPGWVMPPQSLVPPPPVFQPDPLYPSPPRPSSFGRFLDYAGSALLILIGATLFIIGMPLKYVLVGFVLMPIGVMCVIVGTVMLFKS
ncbi:MAG: hypothetical protein DVB22_002563 [Verrucomicrobia bacterium]|nr:MAG: hypothetical protein DVB22_002563 [Verrucomicrobiota bacterium]